MKCKLFNLYFFIALNGVELVEMTIAGDDIVKNCGTCFFENGYSAHLNQKGDILVCPLDSTHRYAVSGGFLKKV